MDVALHPEFTENRLVYWTYSKPAGEGAWVTLARGRLTEHGLADVEDLFRSDPVGGTAASRVVFAPDGSLYMTVGGAFGAATGGPRAQDPGDTVGKVVRLLDDGGIPDDNPFVGRDGHRPEIYSLGHRNQLGAALHPETGELWANENGPLGGDEVNRIRPGGNYGWPVVSYSREYSGGRVADRTFQEGMEPARDRLAALGRSVRHGVLRRRPLSQLARPPLRRLAAHRHDPQHRPPRAHRLQ